jgi:hypothetical protein
MFAPRSNITVAARQIAQLAERCTILSRFKADPIHCGIAAYHGPREPPDAVFADAVKESVLKPDAQYFDMPKDAYFGTNDAAVDALRSDPHAAPTALGAPSDDDDRAWSSALVRVKLPWPGGGRDELFGHVSHVVDCFCMFESEAGRGRVLDRFWARLKQTKFAPPSGRESAVCTLG